MTRMKTVEKMMFGNQKKNQEMRKVFPKDMDSFVLL